jgi:SAM-dependent methyltransferase
MAVRELPLRTVLADSIIGNRIRAKAYTRWVTGLGLKSTDRVLDVGVRGGAEARHIAPLVDKGSLTCLDIDGRWLDVARKRLRRFANVEYVEADACEWERPARYDVAVMHHVLHEIPSDSRAEAVQRIREDLVGGGRLCVCEPVAEAMSEEEMNALMTRAGLERVESDLRGSGPWLGEWVSSIWRKPAEALA